MDGAQVVRTGRRPASWVVASLPHGGRTVPASVVDDLTIDADDLVSDWHTPDLYDFLADIGIPSVVNRLSRWVADPNREPLLDPSTPNGPVASTDFSGRTLHKRAPSSAQIERRIAIAHAPFHAALDALVDEAIAAHGRAVVFDLHCFAADLDADIVLGDRHGTTASREVVAALEVALRAVGFNVAVNLRWIGGWIVKRLGARPDVDAVQIELNARTYVYPELVDQLPPLPPVLKPRFDDVRDRLRTALRRSVAAT